MPSNQPAVRLAAGAEAWLDAYTAARPVWDTRPSVATSPGPATAVAGHIDLRQDDAVLGIIHAVRREWLAAPRRSRDDVVDAVADSTGLSRADIRAAMLRWAAQPDTVNALLHAANAR